MIGNMKLFLNTNIHIAIHLYWVIQMPSYIDGTEVITAYKGGDAILPTCLRENSPTTIRWTRVVDKAFLAGIRESGAPFTPHKKKYDFDKHTNLVVYDIEDADEGIYNCRELHADDLGVQFYLEVKADRPKDEQSTEVEGLITSLKTFVTTQHPRKSPHAKKDPKGLMSDEAISTYADKQLSEVEEYMTSSEIFDNVTKQHSGNSLHTGKLNKEDRQPIDVEVVTVSYKPFVAIHHSEKSEHDKDITDATSISKSIKTLGDSPSYEDSRFHIALPVLSAVLVLISFVMVVVTWKLWRKGHTNSTKEAYDQRFSQPGDTVELRPCQRPSDPDITHNENDDEEALVQDPWEHSRDNLVISDEYLGHGAFGTVVKAFASNIKGHAGQIEVAVKTLRADAIYEERYDFLRELSIMKSFSISHPNVVSLLGCCTEKEPILIIVEIAKYGSLLDHIQKNRSKCIYSNLHSNSRDLTPTDLLRFSWQIAKGMSYLESNNCLHRDLAARNILLGDNRTCKIADFGLARDLNGSNVYTMKSVQGRLPLRWMAIESLRNSVHTSKSDVWSYGVLLWELVTLGSHPYGSMSTNEVLNSIYRGQRMEKPSHCDNEIYKIMIDCWMEDPDDRPLFFDLCARVGKIANDTTKMYLTMKNFDEHDYVNIPTSGIEVGDIQDS